MYFALQFVIFMISITTWVSLFAVQTIINYRQITLYKKRFFIYLYTYSSKCLSYFFLIIKDLSVISMNREQLSKYFTLEWISIVWLTEKTVNPVFSSCNKSNKWNRQMNKKKKNRQTFSNWKTIQILGINAQKLYSRILKTNDA